MPKTSATQNYAVRLRCPHGDEDTWIVLEKREETLEQILKTPLDFECAVHGVQRQLPLEANGKGPPLAGKPAWPGAAKPKPQTGQRSGKRLSLKVPVLAYGWVKSQGAFHEETTTSVVNASGGLLTLTTKVELGETFFLVNKATHVEQECRVAYVQRESDHCSKVGIAFKRKAPAFWRVSRKYPRIPKTLRVWVRGVDSSGNPFVQSAYTVEISQVGARLNGLGCVTRPGEVIELKRGWQKARFRVVWIGQMGTPQADEIGILCLEDAKNIWGVTVPKPELHRRD
jgi:hypothetical protein